MRQINDDTRGAFDGSQDSHGLPSEIVAPIAAATPAQLDQWGGCVLDAATLMEVFRW